MSGFFGSSAGGGGGDGNITVSDNGTPVGSRPEINLIEGAGATLTVTDDAGNNRVNVTIAATSGGSAGFELFEEGVSQGVVDTLNVVGATVTASASGADGTLTISAPALASAAPENVTKAAAAVGSGTTAARVDHKHDISTATASTLSVGGSNAEGTATSLARSDHTHALPAFGSTAGTFAEGNDSRFATFVVGPGSATDNAVARFDATTGKLVQNSAVTIDDSGNIATAGTVDGRDVSTDGTKLDGIASGATNGVTVQEEGTPVGTNQTTFNFVGASVTASVVGAVTTVTISAGGGGGDALTTDPLSQFAATTSAQLAGVISDETGSGALVFATSPTLTTPVLGVASATSVNKVAFTAPATGATLTIADGATLTASANATVSGTNTGDQTNITGNAATVTTNANLTGIVTSTGNATAIANGAIAIAKLANIATDRLLGRDTAASGAVEELTVGGGVEFTGTGIQRSALTGDVTATAGSNATTIAANAVSFAKMATQAALSVVANATNATAVPSAVAASVDGHVMRRSGTALAFGTVATAGITDAAVTLAKMANLAQDQFIGRVTASTGVPETATITAAARTVLDDTTVSAMVNTLGGATATGTGGLVRLASPVFTGNVSITIPSTVTTAGTTATIDWANGNAQVFDAQGSTGNVTFTFSNPASGASYVLKLIQGSTARTYVWPATVKWPAATAPTVTATNDGIDVCTFFWDGTNYLGSYTTGHG